MIGVGITTTPERQDMFRETFRKHFEFKPSSNFKLIVHDDVDHEGVPRAKNHLLRQLDQCDHIFLFDDDCHPITKDWWKPYVEHPEPHLMYQFKLAGKPRSDMRELFRDKTTVAYSHTRGAMLYITREVLEKVGGFDTAYGIGGYEHPDFTNRIHNAGLTTYRAMDVPNSHELLYCLDQDGLVESTLPKSNYGNHHLYLKSKTSSDYKEYK